METTNTMRKIYFVSLCVSALIIFSFCHGNHIVSAGTDVGASVGKKAPPFTLPNIDGSEFELKTFNKDKCVLLVFSTTWCPGCRHEIPLIKNFYEEFKDDGLAIAVIDIGEHSSKVKAFVKKRDINYNVVLDETGTVAKNFRVTGIPLNIVLDKSGTIIYRDHAPPDKDFIKNLIAN
ncbi:MAG: TlpA family protein disulfide reductase [Planctomycetes bacterium]|nr:TlpA family protein disulfide reductase [Planctomycetota bacterium]